MNFAEKVAVRGAVSLAIGFLEGEHSHVAFGPEHVLEALRDAKRFLGAIDPLEMESARPAWTTSWKCANGHEIEVKSDRLGRALPPFACAVCGSQTIEFLSACPLPALEESGLTDAEADKLGAALSEPDPDDGSLTFSYEPPPVDVLTVEGYKYAGVLFRELGTLMPLGIPFFLDKRQDGVIGVTRIEQWRATTLDQELVRVLELHDLRRWARYERAEGVFFHLRCYCGAVVEEDTQRAMFQHVAGELRKAMRI